MAKTDKSNKKGTSKKADPIKGKSTVPASSKEILAKAAALAKPTPKKIVDSSDDSSSEESSSEDSDISEKGRASAPVKTTPVPGAFSLGGTIIAL